MTDFSDFHQNTMAVFTPQTPPEREPDFISPAGSVYWDLGSGVLRASDHWAGHLGCTGQASCIWRIRADEPDFGTYLSGYCAYEAFHRRRMVPVPHNVRETDCALALEMSLYGAARPIRDTLPPPWAQRAYKHSVLLSPTLKDWFRRNGDCATALWAEPRFVQEICSGKPEVILFYREEQPDKAFWGDF